MVENVPSTGPADALLAEIAPLTGDERMRRSALHAVEHAGTDHLATTIAGLNALGHADLGVHMALAARDLALVIDYLNGDDQELRRSVLLRSRDVPLPDEVLEAVLDDAPHRLRRTLYTVLYRTGRETVADRILPRVRHRHGVREAALLLPACSTPVVEEDLDGLAHLVETWSRFARRHPEVLLRYLEREAGSSERRGRIWRNPWSEMAEALDEYRPELLVPFVRDRTDPAAPSSLFPRTHRFLRTSGDRYHYPARYPAYKWGRRDLRGLMAEMRRAGPRVLGVLRAMSRDDRAPILERFVAEGGGEDIGLLPYLGLMPVERRGNEARRILRRVERAPVDGGRHADLEALAHLPFHEAEPDLTGAAGDSDADRRERALYWLLRAAAEHGPMSLTRVLAARLERGAADRDAVRRSIPLALGVLSPASLETEALSCLRRLLDDVLAAPDTTDTTRWALRHLALRLLHHPDGRGREELAETALHILVRLIERHGEDGFGEHGRYGASGYVTWHRVPTLKWTPTPAEALTPEQARELYSRLAPILARRRARGEHRSTVALARALGERLLPEVPDLLLHDLRDVIVAGPTDTVARDAASLHLRGDRRGTRARALFREDPRCALIPEVWEHLARTRPALVPEVLTAVDDLHARVRRLSGRYLGIDRRATRTWLKTEHRYAAEYLKGVAERAADDVHAVIDALDGSSVLLDAADHLLPWLETDDPRVREAALVRLARTDRPECALRTLLEHAERGTDSRAVVAVLDSCARRVRPAVLMNVLGEVLTGPAKVTLRKSAARILGRTGVPGAVELLTGLLDDEELHHDVRTAVVGEIVGNGDHPAALSALEAHRERLTTPEDQAVLLNTDPRTLPAELRPRVARLVMSLPATGRSSFDRSGYMRRLVAGWALYDENLAERLITELYDPAIPDEVAVGGYVGLLRHRRYRRELPEVLTHLVELCPTPDAGVPERLPPGEEPSSLPRRVAHIIEAFVPHIRNRQELEAPMPGLDRAVAVLAAHPGFGTEALSLLRADLPALNDTRYLRVPTDVLLTRVRTWADLAGRRPEADGASPETAAERIAPRWSGTAMNPNTLETLVRGLIAAAERETGPTGRTIGGVALRILVREGERRKWAGPWVEMVADLGRSPHEVVRTAAWRAAVL